jgi:hypothetical protein
MRYSMVIEHGAAASQTAKAAGNFLIGGTLRPALVRKMNGCCTPRSKSVQAENAIPVVEGGL